MNRENEFIQGKKSALSKLKKAQKEKKVDLGILSILNLINKSEDYYTSSSCFGRIVLLEIPRIGDKKQAKFLGKWHSTVSTDEMISAAKKAKKGHIWLLSQSSIIHIIAKTGDAADWILKTAIKCGFKNSGIKSFGKKFVVEVCSTERLDVPVGKDGDIFCNKNHLDLLVEISNEIIKKSTNKLHKFEETLKKHLETNSTGIKKIKKES
jgi:tRNA wybutosine-synthesizing protein 3